MNLSFGGLKLRERLPFIRYSTAVESVSLRNMSPVPP